MVEEFGLHVVDATCSIIEQQRKVRQTVMESMGDLVEQHASKAGKKTRAARERR